MALVRPEAKLTYSDPASDGVVTQFGLSRDWRPDGTWSGNWCEWIEPLGAIAPAGDGRPVNMTIGSNWVRDTSYGDKLRNVRPSGQVGADWVLHYDGSVHAPGTSTLTAGSATYSAAAMTPNLAVHIKRYTPPPAQGVIAQFMTRWSVMLRVSQDGSRYYLDDNPLTSAWVPGYMMMIEAWNDPRYTAPLLHVRATAEAEAGIFDSGQIVSTSPWQVQTDQGPVQESFLIEAVPDYQQNKQFSGTHILIRRSDTSDWWHFYDPRIRTIDGTIWNMACGAIVAYNVSPMLYTGAEGVCVTRPNTWQPLPGGRWNETATWEVLASAPTGWETTAADAERSPYSNLKVYMPQVTFTRSTSAAEKWRPVLWLVRETHAAVNEVPAGLPASTDTSGDGALHSLSWEMDYTWRHARGTATFLPATSARYTDWNEGGLVTVNFGWGSDQDTNYKTQDIANAYILRGGIRRWRRGNEYRGQPMVSMELGDYVTHRLQETCIIDLCQAGGMNFLAWAQMVANRLGLPPAKLYVQEGIDAYTIPVFDPIPSRPHLWAQDGASWEQHIAEVCHACNVRWGWDQQLFFDNGCPAYTPGVSVITAELEAGTTTQENLITEIVSELDDPNYRNSFKAHYGPEDRRRVTYKPAEIALLQAEGGDSWAYIDDQAANNEASLLAEYQREYGRTRLIRYTGLLQPHIVPDMFVRLKDVDGIGQTDETVWRVIRHAMRLCNSPYQATSEIVAALVYTPGLESGLAGLAVGSGLGTRTPGGVTP